MALPELIANSSIPGEVTILTELAKECTAIATEIEVKAKPPAALEAAGQFRIVIGQEIILVTGGQTTTKWTVARAQEGSTGAIHAINTPVYHFLTAGALKEFPQSGNTVAMAYRKAKQKIPDAAYTLVKLDTVIKDPGSNVNVAEGFYTVPAEGYYQVSANVALKAAASTEIYAVIYVNGVAKITGGTGINTVEESAASSVAGIAFCKAADKIELRVYQHNAVAKEQETLENETDNRLSVVRVA
jgi:hypothetical protein